MEKHRRRAPQKGYYKILNGVAVAALTGTFLYLILMWNRLPEQIPSHFNGAGQADGWSGKGALWFSPVMAVLLYGGISLLEQFPDLWNTGIEVTPENREQVLGAIKTMVVWTKTSAVLSFCWMTICSARQANLGVWFLPVFLGMMFFPIIWCCIRIFRLGKRGKGGY